jgi:hypothetical protein
MGVKLGHLKSRGKHRLRVFENRVLKGEKTNLYFSLNTVRMIKSRKIRCIVHVVNMGVMSVCTGFIWVRTGISGRLL